MKYLHCVTNTQDTVMGDAKIIEIILVNWNVWWYGENICVDESLQ
jgi:hypothetical protein